MIHTRKLLLELSSYSYCVLPTAWLHGGAHGAVVVVPSTSSPIVRGCMSCASRPSDSILNDAGMRKLGCLIVGRVLLDRVSLLKVL